MIKEIQKKLGIGTVKKQGILENQANYVYLALGSNLGNKINNLIKTQQLILESNIQIVKSSNFYKTESWPNKNFPFYVNSVILVKTPLNPIKLLNTIKSIEVMIGRKKARKNHPRVCDIDIIDFNGKVYNLERNNKKLSIPHKSMHLRNFVLFPLFEISKNWSHPISKRNIKDLIFSLPTKELRTIKLI